MDILEAKNIVIAAGEKLVEEGLIARTWGNISARVDDKTFVITPSGKPYIGLTPDDIVEVAIEDLAWEGDVKPSSEKGIHAEVYKQYPDANFVIHTHQKVASAVSVLKKGIDSLTGAAKEVIGDNILVARYGLSSTKKLKRNVAAALHATTSKAVVMAHHGAVCYGKDVDEAFEVARMLEKTSEEYLLAGAKEKYGVSVDTLDAFCELVVSKVTGESGSLSVDKSALYDSECDREAGNIKLTNCANGEEMNIDLATGACDSNIYGTAAAHRAIYLSQPKFNYIVHNYDKETLAVSTIGKTMKPLLDDFGQLCGTKVKVAKNEAECGKKIKGKNAVLLKDRGALCCGGVKSDAEAVSMIMSKAALAQLATNVYEAAKPVSPIEALLERIIYLKKYSKQAEK